MAESIDPRARGMRDPAFDLPVLGFGALVTAGLSISLATALLYASRAHTGQNVGPTAATLDDAFATFAGAALGLALGSAACAALARRGSRLATGLFVGFIAYAAALVPAVVATGPSDMSVGESIGVALFAGIPLGFAVLIGAAIGAGIGSKWRPSQSGGRVRGH